MVTKDDMKFTLGVIEDLSIEQLEKLELIILNRKAFLQLENDYYEEAFKQLG